MTVPSKKTKTKPKAKPEPERAYHHGDLRRELLKAARQEVARSGATGFSLSALARLAGVSQAAPYRHFANMNDLLEALAVEGFEELHAAVALAGEDGKATDPLQAIALAYVDYAGRHMELYRLMFASRLVPQATPGSLLAEAADRAFEQLRRVVARTSPPETLRDDAILIWAQLHGLLMLKADGLIETPLSHFVTASTVLSRPMTVARRT